MFRCDICGKCYPTEYDAKHCEFVHEEFDFANFIYHIFRVDYTGFFQGNGGKE